MTVWAPRRAIVITVTRGIVIVRCVGAGRNHGDQILHVVDDAGRMRDEDESEQTQNEHEAMHCLRQWS